jgi:hypothetical protein
MEHSFTGQFLAPVLEKAGVPSARASIVAGTRRRASKKTTSAKAATARKPVTARNAASRRSTA